MNSAIGTTVPSSKTSSLSSPRINRIKEHVEQETFLSIFAEPQDYEKMRDSLTPISILFIFSKLYEDFENGRITTFFVRNSKLGKERRFNLS